MMAQMSFKGGAVDISSDHIEHARLTGSVSAIRVQGTAAEKVDRSSLKIR
jgi:hypothetical protein